MGERPKNISKMLVITKGNIADKKFLKKHHIDAIVNAANPTLMKSEGEKAGREQSVNLSIHNAVDKGKKDGYFEKKINAKLGTNTQNQEIRCQRGNAVLTKGYGLCNYIIHVVGAEYDGIQQKRSGACSSSKKEILESCYYGIVSILKQHTDIASIAVPIIGAGNYGFPFALAARIAAASMANALIEWRTQDPEMFEMASIREIHFVIYDKNKNIQRKHFLCMDQILDGYAPLIGENQKVVFQDSFTAHYGYINEIKKYDEQRGYFSVARNIRLLLMWLRLLFFPAMCFKDSYGKYNWRKRRQSVELLAIFKIALPLLCFFLLSRFPAGKAPALLAGTAAGITIYSMCDTITYLLILILMADIQRPSANLIRSMMMLFVNYIETALDTAFLYWASFRESRSLEDALQFGLLGDYNAAGAAGATAFANCFWPCLHASIQFFFLTLVFGYLANHMRQKKFIS